jgi:hypothetical protein
MREANAVLDRQTIDMVLKNAATVGDFSFALGCSAKMPSRSYLWQYERRSCQTLRMFLPASGRQGV